MNIFSKSMDLDSIIKYVRNIDKKIILFGLSEITKNNINKFDNIYAIVDNNKNIQGKVFEKIKICSPNILLERSDFLVIFWGQHIENMLQQMGKNEYIICSNKTNSLLKLEKDYFFTTQNSKKTFKKNITSIDIELHSYCNRTCWFCPNSFIDRKKNNQYFDKNIFTSMMEDLSLINYDNYISFNGYSEPMANKYLKEYLEIAKDYLPNAKLHINTNGDFLNSKKIEELYLSGLKSMWIQIYLDKDEEFSFKIIDDKFTKIMSNTGVVKYELKSRTANYVEYNCIYKDMEIKAYARDFSKNGVNRGDLKVNETIYVRDNPCSSIFNQVIINHKSEVLPCCHIRTDYEKHKTFSLGSLKDNGIFDIFKNKKYIDWRKSLLYFNKKFKYPCTNCNFMTVKKTNILSEHINKLNKGL